MSFDPHQPHHFAKAACCRCRAGHEGDRSGNLTLVGQIAETTHGEMHAALERQALPSAGCEARCQDTRHASARIANRIEAEDLRRCAELMTREMGKPYPEAIGELANCAAAFRYFAEMARDDGGQGRGHHPGRLLPVRAL